MVRVYGSRISYYTGKLETYLRYRSIDYELWPTVGHDRELREAVGVVQMPVVRLDDGRWMTDSTPMLAWLESQQQAPAIYPDDPTLRFAALLLEDYADEWLWRPAMHYRWSYPLSRAYASGFLADELLTRHPLPRFLKQRLLIRRQLGGFVRGDGVNRSTWDHVEQGYTNALDRLEAIFAERRFVLGDAPSVADFGLMGPMFRHFGEDPVPAEIMRSRAPGVYAWVARMWNTSASTDAPRWLSEIDAPLSALLREAGETHLVQLRANATAFARGERRTDQTVQGCRYSQVPVSRYRVWCLEELRREWQALDDPARATLRAHVSAPGSAVLDEAALPAGSGYDPERRAPFNRAINVFGTGVPR
jgi:glutathione S-transferase